MQKISMVRLRFFSGKKNENVENNAEFTIQSREIKNIIQMSKQVTTLQYICPTGSQSYL